MKIFIIPIMGNRKFSLATIIMATIPTIAYGGFLTAEKFPTTVADVSFNDRVENKGAGYAPYKDADAYMAIELQKYEDALADEIEKIEQEHEIYCMGPGARMPECQPVTRESLAAGTAVDTPANAPATASTSTLPAQNITGGALIGVAAGGAAVTGTAPSGNAPAATGTPGTYCATRHPHIPAGQLQPLGVPLSPDLDVYDKAKKGMVCSGFSVGRGGGWKHHGTDIGCGEKYFGTPVYAAGDGRVSIVKHWDNNSTAGNYVAIDHVDGFRSMYMHLDTITVTQGQNVSAGCQIGTVGHTGGSVGLKRQGKPWQIQKSMSHLHYELSNSKHPSKMDTPKGPIPINEYLKNSFNSIEMLKYTP